MTWMGNLLQALHGTVSQLWKLHSLKHIKASDEKWGLLLMFVFISKNEYSFSNILESMI